MLSGSRQMQQTGCSASASCPPAAPCSGVPASAMAGGLERQDLRLFRFQRGDRTAVARAQAARGNISWAWGQLGGLTNTGR